MARKKEKKAEQPHKVVCAGLRLKDASIEISIDRSFGLISGKLIDADTGIKYAISGVIEEEE